MEDAEWEAIRKNFVYLKDQLDTDSILDHLYTEGKLTEDNREAIKVTAERRERTDKLLFNLKRTHGSFNALCDICDKIKQKHISERLRKDKANQLSKKLSARQHEMSEYQQILYEDQLERDKETIALLERRIRQLESQSKNDQQRKEQEVLETPGVTAKGNERKDNQETGQASASQLLHNSPDIADPSDSNNATKLAEKYTELYDNEWTDAFDEGIDSGNKTEKEAVKDLYDILKAAYDHCKKTFTEYSKGAKMSFIYFRGQEGQYDKLPTVVDKQAQDTVKSFAPALTEKIIESFMSEKSIKNCPRKNTYMRKCVELCWLMAIQDPPVVLSTENPTEFNPDLYKAFTKFGKHVDYVVMPPLHMHKGGALLAKGTAQGKFWRM